MDYKVKIDQFEGPLDLLLHLIKEANIDIYDIKLEEITSQYLDYIKAMEELNLSIAGDYLVIAAELLEIKSKMLLPRNNSAEDSDYEEDPREALIQKLIDYKNYKEITTKFKDLAETRQFIYTKLPSELGMYCDDKLIKNNGEVSITDLLMAFQKLLSRQDQQRPLTTKITAKETSIKERTNSIRIILKQRKRVIFADLIDVFTKEYIIVTFLSILEMARKKEIIIKQDYKFDEIYLELQGLV